MSKGVHITIGGKKYSAEFLGIKDTDEIRVMRNSFNQP